MEAALGSKPAEGELQRVHLRKLMAEDEWDETKDLPGQRRGSEKLREAAEFRPVDMPSSRGAAWRNLENGSPEELALRQHAMNLQRRLVVARIEETLGHVRTGLVNQANTYLQQIRSRGGANHPGYHLSNANYAEVQKQGQAVRVLAQIHNICQEKLLRLNWDLSPVGKASSTDLLNRYRPLSSADLKCSTETYSTRGTSSKFSLPWFWRMVPINLQETEEEARAKDEKFVAECKRNISLYVASPDHSLQSSGSAGSTPNVR